jgi:protein-disulfide isomerase
MSRHNHETLTLPLAVLIAGLCVSASIYAGAREIANGPASRVSVGQAPEKSAPINVAPVTSKDHIRGSSAAKIMLVEYSDLECPFCKQYHAAIKEAIASYPPGTVAWVYRHFPLAIHPKAQIEAEAAECANAQGGNDAFWKFIDRVFEITPSNNRLEESELPKIAQSIGLDIPAFQSCLQNRSQKATVDAQAKSGAAAGATGTPYTVIVSKSASMPIKGAVSGATLKNDIDTILDRK